MSMTFSPCKPATKKWILFSQIRGKNITAEVALTRALRLGDRRLNCSSLASLHVAADLAREVREKASQMELSFGDTQEC